MLATFTFAMLEILAPFCVGTPLMMLLMGNCTYEATEILGIFPTFILAFVLTVAFCCILNLITLPFTRYSVFLFDDHFSHGNTDVKYDDVTRIEIDSGMVSRQMSGNDPCCLDFYSGEKLLASIKHPSLLMSFFVWRKCKNARLKYKRVKKLALTWALVLLICIVLGLYGAK